MERICICPKDVAAHLGKGIRYSQKLIKDLKFILKKEKHQPVTKQELADYLGIDVNLIRLK